MSGIRPLTNLAFVFVLEMAFALPLRAQDLTIAADDNSSAWLSLSEESLTQLPDVSLRLERQRAPETDITLRAYRVVAYQTSTGKEMTPFHLPQAIWVHVGLDGLLEVPRFASASAQAQTEHDLFQLLNLFWDSGAGFFRLEGIQQDGNSLSFPIQNTGLYQIRAMVPAKELRLLPGSPYPRLITPNAANNHRVFFFFEGPADLIVSGALYDLHGAKVQILK